METRLIIAYSLIAIMAGLGILGAIIVSRKRKAAQRRNAGRSGML